ncbi:MULTISPECIES: helix-turn-helix domain-containing protein [Pseudomonas]|jgi:transcriptional regulator with XRE-family HTH domain|uniref:helix-turn-helix domain-containing protein n=1 Tax=Pseudomonas TaxID=286 RepID=UPI000CFEFAD9|nr:MULTISPECIES: helix-turn-helix transcriptional regulator [Pseudomonas]PRA54708.1 transcriptional regulator [Pseudomonas sp. MYb115]QXN49708.1 helix-turn-helix domain-containing protein [Pseudomonas fluorescens]WSO24022.1 helix-turn-helix transcriptional regulator [Pseudomonas fluorescens]
MELKKAFGLAVRDIRLSKGLSQEALGPSQPFVSDLERGIKSPSLEKIHDLASSLGVHPSTLFVYCCIKADGAKESTDEIMARVLEELSSIELRGKG